MYAASLLVLGHWEEAADAYAKAAEHDPRPERRAALRPGGRPVRAGPDAEAEQEVAAATAVNRDWPEGVLGLARAAIMDEKTRDNPDGPAVGADLGQARDSLPGKAVARSTSTRLASATPPTATSPRRRAVPVVAPARPGRPLGEPAPRPAAVLRAEAGAVGGVGGGAAACLPPPSHLATPPPSASGIELTNLVLARANLNRVWIPTFIPTAERRKQVKLRIRADLVITEQRYEGRLCHVVKDPVSLKYYRFNQQEYYVFERLNGGEHAGGHPQGVREAVRPGPADPGGPGRVRPPARDRRAGPARVAERRPASCSTSAASSGGPSGSRRSPTSCTSRSRSSTRTAC